MFHRNNYACEVCNKPYANKNACFKHEVICKLSHGINILDDKNTNDAITYLFNEVRKLNMDIRTIRNLRSFRNVAYNDRLINLRNNDNRLFYSR